MLLQNEDNLLYKAAVSLCLVLSCIVLYCLVLSCLVLCLVLANTQMESSGQGWGAWSSLVKMC